MILFITSFHQSQRQNHLAKPFGRYHFSLALCSYAFAYFILPMFYIANFFALIIESTANKDCFSVCHSLIHPQAINFFWLFAICIFY